MITQISSNRSFHKLRITHFYGSGHSKKIRLLCAVSTVTNNRLKLKKCIHKDIFTKFFIYLSSMTATVWWSIVALIQPSHVLMMNKICICYLKIKAADNKSRFYSAINVLVRYLKVLYVFASFEKSIMYLYYSWLDIFESVNMTSTLLESFI